MKKILYVLVVFFGWSTIAQAQVCTGNSHGCNDGSLAKCQYSQAMPGGPIRPTYLCPNEAPPPSFMGNGLGGNQNTGSNANQNSQTGPMPCGQNAMNNIPTVLNSWGVGAPATPPAGRPTMPTPPPTRAQSFMQTILGFAASIVAGDNTANCSYVPKSPEGKTLLACTQEAETDGTYQRYLNEEIRINTASGIPRNEISGKSARDARSRILKECEGRLGIDRRTLQPTERVCR